MPTSTDKMENNSSKTKSHYTLRKLDTKHPYEMVDISQFFKATDEYIASKSTLETEAPLEKHILYLDLDECLVTETVSTEVIPDDSKLTIELKSK
jgi:hypothetical protein